MYCLLYLHNVLLYIVAQLYKIKLYITFLHKLFLLNEHINKDTKHYLED